MHLRAVGASKAPGLGQVALSLAMLPHDAFLSADAISRTLFRMLITRRRLLEWRTSSDVTRSARTSLTGSFLTMWFSPLVALTSAVALSVTYPAHLPLALPFLLLWLAAPWIAWRISQPIKSRAPQLTAEQVAFLRRIARKTWHFFETFVTAEENWLPPDNFQEKPTGRVAARTSPTNIGLALLGNLAARDLGYLSLGRLLERTEATLATLLRLERHRGHFYNWYSTRTLQPLLPLYVSSVDSGNLAGHLLTLAAGLRQIADEKILNPQIFAGLRDTLGVIRRLTGENALLTQLNAELQNAPASLREALALLQRASGQAAHIARSLANRKEDLKAWEQILERECAQHFAELNAFATSEDNPTWRELSQLHPQAREHVRKLEALASQCDELAGMDFTFLFDPARNLFAIGFNITENRRDQSFYDLLASEARLCSYVAIAQGQVPQDHWFSLGRLIVAPRGSRSGLLGGLDVRASDAAPRNAEL